MNKLYMVFSTVFLYVSFFSCTTTPITGNKSLILVPFSQELALGSQSYKEVLGKEANNINKDPRVNAIVQRVAMRIAKVSDMPNLQWEFTVINSKEMNAFCLPGGKIVVYTGIFPVAGNEAGLATVLSHEISHAIARHGAQRMTQGLILTAGLSAASLSLENNKYKDLIIASIGAGATVGIVLPFSRKDEYEADEMGFIYMARAGYNPNEAVLFWNRFANMAKSSSPEFLSTHPISEHRSERLNSYLGRAQQEYARSPQYGSGERL
jgi:metalloendopeptidase OMA1, mitochondrial